MIYVYGIVDDPELSVEGERGLGDAPIVCLANGPVAAVCTVHSQLELSAEPASLWRHERVTASLLARCTVAPARFGTVVADTGHLGGLLAERRPQLTALLSRLRGNVELAVRASAPPDAPHPAHPDPAPPGPVRAEPGPGRAYLRSLAEGNADVATTPASLRELHTALSGRAVASSRQQSAAGSLVAAYLVAAARVEAFRDDLARVRASHAEVHASLTGPWAPFTFATEGALSDA